MYIFAGVTAVALAAGAVAVYFKMTQTESDGASDLSSQYKDLNVSLEPPPSPWVRDDSTPNDILGSPFSSSPTAGKTPKPTWPLAHATTRRACRGTASSKAV